MHLALRREGPDFVQLHATGTPYLLLYRLDVPPAERAYFDTLTSARWASFVERYGMTLEQLRTGALRFFVTEAECNAHEQTVQQAVAMLHGLLMRPMPESWTRRLEALDQEIAALVAH